MQALAIFPCEKRPHTALISLSEGYSVLKGRLLTCYAPVRHLTFQSKLQSVSFDLHVLSTPPAFVLSQNQTLRRNFDWLDRCSKQLPKLTCRGVVKLPGPAHWRTNHAAHNLALSFHPANLIRGCPEATSNVRRRAGPTLLKSFSIVGTKKPTGLASRSTSWLSLTCRFARRAGPYLSESRRQQVSSLFCCFFLSGAKTLKTLILMLYFRFSSR